MKDTIYRVQDLLTYGAELSLWVHGHFVTFDLSNPHEARYALQALTGLPYPQSDIDRALFRVFVRPGDVCLDLGANIGISALEMLACEAAEVIAFEPVQALARRLYALDEPRLQIHGLAVSDTLGYADITLSQTHNQGHSLDRATVARFPGVFGQAARTERVITVTLDAFFDGHPAGDVWKMDVEGAEHATLRGAQRLLAEVPPRVILCECYDRAEDLFALLGPGWAALRAQLRRDDNSLEFTPPFGPGDPETYAGISPTYVFYREGTEALPTGLTIRTA